MGDTLKKIRIKRNSQPMALHTHLNQGAIDPSLVLVLIKMLINA